MELSVPLRGFAIGFGIAAPVGQIGILCIRRTLADWRAVGFAAGLGAATADALYGAAAAFGLTLVSSALVGQRAWLRAVGGVSSCATWASGHGWLRPPRQRQPPAAGRGS